MGLLDEAIREHLELKRRRGADPTEIARAEREALEPVFPGEHPRGTDSVPEDGEPTIPVEHAGAVEGVDGVEPEYEEAHVDGAVHGVDSGFSTLGQETAELDVEAYMDSVDGAADGANGAVEGVGGDLDGVDGAVEDIEGAAPAPAEAQAPLAEGPGVIGDEMLDWEEPHVARSEPPPEQIPGQERLSLD